MKGTIGVNVPELRAQIAKLQQLEGRVSQCAAIDALVFGQNNPGKSTGEAAGGMRGMNAEYRKTAVQLAALVRATVRYLNGVATTYEKADGQGG